MTHFSAQHFDKDCFKLFVGFPSGVFEAQSELYLPHPSTSATGLATEAFDVLKMSERPCLFILVK